MNTKEQDSNQKLETPNSKLQKSSVIFMQLGLIIALLAVYFTLEHKSFIKRYAYVEPKSNTHIYEDTFVKDFNIEKEKVKIIKTKKTEPTVIVKTLEKLTLIENTEEQKETKDNLFKQDLVVKQVTKSEINLDNVPDEPIEFTEKAKLLSFKRIEKAPEFPGCKGNETQKRACFNKKMGKHVNKYFNIDLAQDLGLSAGKKRINVQFIIDELGNITAIKSNATHIRLKKEAERIVKKLPKMIPGKQRNKAVKVKFNLPINFMVED